MKKAQITLFIIMGVALFLLFGLMFIVFSNTGLIKTSSKNLNLETYIEENLRFSAKYCINKVGMQGGYYKPKNFLEKPYSKIEYAYANSNNFLSLESLKTEIESCIVETLEGCIDDFNIFKKMGYKIEYGKIKPKIVLAAKDLPVMTGFNIKSAIKDEEQTYDEFKADSIQVRLRRLHNITATITNLIEEQMKSSDIDLSYLGSIEVNSFVYEEENNQQIYSLEDPGSVIDNKDYYFLFCNKY